MSATTTKIRYSIGGSGGRARHTPTYGIQFFRFCIHFHRKVPASEAHPLTGPRPPTGNPGSANVYESPNGKFYELSDNLRDATEAKLIVYFAHGLFEKGVIPRGLFNQLL